MAVKKTQLYASLWASCDKLRGGMDSSEYKDYILTLLFMKYVTDKFKNKGAYEDIRVFDKAHDKDPDPEKRTGCSFDDFIALKGKKNIGEGMDKIIARLADENTDLKGVIDIAHFNDEKKLGSGKEMVDKLTDLISIFQRPELDFSRNKTEGDDIIGDAYEYLMRKFATESGKSKGQFYTPAEVSRILANVVGISRCTDTSATVCDPACGSGSLLIRAIDAAPIPIMGYGQEKESTTAGLAKMNAVLHRKAEITIKSGNTFSNPQYLDKSDNSILERFDYIVANPPFSMKNWRDGIAGKEYGRFEGYGDTPPEKNGDYAWLMHILKALKSNGKAAVILPHGVLFRGNAEATIREAIYRFTIDKQGEILPTIRDADGFVKQVRLEDMALTPNLTQSLNNLSTHAVMAQILDEIEYVGDAIREIHVELQNDRLAMAEGARDKLIQARLIQDAKLREAAMLDVIHSATDAKRVLMRNFSQNMYHITEHSQKSDFQMMLDFKGEKDVSRKAIDAFQALVYITNSVQTECEGYAMLGEYEPCKECLEEFKSFILENRLNERDTLLLLNENSSQKRIEVVDQFTDIAARITAFDPKAHIEYSVHNLLTAETEHTGGDSDEQ